ncbi:MAG: hypothetical protein IID34_04100 [Planctomycetes bacterium]|nr:hypothetical protein [Planctomycetota bacterium]
MSRSKFCRVSVPVGGALGVFVLVCALGATADAFDAPTVKTPGAAQPQGLEQSVEPEVGPVVAPATDLRPAEPTRTSMGPTICGNVFPGDCDDNDNGLRSFDPQEFPNAGNCWDHDGDGMCDLAEEDIDQDGDCDIADCHWLGTAYPIVVEGTSIDTITFQNNTNFAGGDIYLTGASGGGPPDCGTCPYDSFPVDGNVGAGDLAFLLGSWGPIPKDADPAVVCLDAGDEPDGLIGAFDLANLLGNWGECPVGFGPVDCNPDVFDMRRMLGCVISGLEPLVPHEIHFEPFATTPGETIWAIFVARTGYAGADALGFYNASSRRSHSVARSDLLPSQLGTSFHNQATTGNVGDWGDFHTLDPLIGTPACVSLSSTGQADEGPFDCVANPEPIGACCGANGDACEMMRGFECGDLNGPGAPTAYLGDGTTCGDCNVSCNLQAGDCCTAHLDGSPGCEDQGCCHFVCGLTPFCCTADKAGWDSLCAVLALGDEEAAVPGCAQQGEVCEPTQCVETALDPSYTCIRSGSNFTIDGTLGFVLDEFGAWTSVDFGGGNEECAFGDKFKPLAFAAAEGVFANALFLYIDRGDPDLNQRAVLSLLEDYAGLYPIILGEAALFPEIPETGASVASDTDADGLNDKLVSSFVTCNALTETFLEWDVVLTVETVASGGGQGVGVLTEVYNIVNSSPVAIDFKLLRQVDSDLLWITNDFQDDVVGTMTHGDIPGADLSVYTMEANRPQTAVTLSSPQATIYYGAKGGDDPDGSGTCDGGFCSAGGPHAGEVCDPLECPGDPVPEDCLCAGGPAMGCGTDLQEWEAFGVPEGWENYIGFVGANIDGECEQFPPGCEAAACPCDGHIGIAIELHLEPAESTCVCVQYTYGQQTPWMGGTCPENCGGPPP